MARAKRAQTKRLIQQHQHRQRKKAVKRTRTPNFNESTDLKTLCEIDCVWHLIWCGTLFSVLCRLPLLLMLVHRSSFFFFFIFLSAASLWKFFRLTLKIKHEILTHGILRFIRIRRCTNVMLVSLLAVCGGIGQCVISSSSNKMGLIIVVKTYHRHQSAASTCWTSCFGLSC